METGSDNIESGRESVRRLLSLYCDAVSRRLPEAVGELFCDDAIVQIADGPERVGREAIVTGLGRTINDFDFMHQKCDTGLIDIAGDGARARISVMEANHRNGADEINMIFGVYEDEYRMGPTGWRFFRRRFTLQFRAVLKMTEAQFFEEFRPAFPFSA